MKDKVPYSQRSFRGKFKYSMLFFAILLIVTLVLWVVMFRGNQLSSIAKYNKTVDAPLTGYDIIDINPSKPNVIEIMYHYKYEDDNGVVYEGDARAYFNDYETADNAIANGQTIKIYIDGKGNSFLADTDISQTKEITILVFSIIFTVGTIAFFIIFLIPVKSKTES